MTLTLCSKNCGRVASGTRDPKTGAWFCLDCAPPRLLLETPKTGDAPRALAGVLGGMNAIACQSPDGERRAEGGEPWEWAPQGRQAVPCKGFAIPARGDGRRMIRELDEDDAQRLVLERALAAVAGDVARLPPDQLAAHLAMTGEQDRKIKRGSRARRKNA